MDKIEQSPTVAFGDRVRAARKKNPDLIQFNVGESDQPTHPNIIKAATNAMIAGHTKYSNSQGLHNLRQGVKKKLYSTNGFQEISEENILITHGAVHGINIALGAILSPGDECIIIEPLWKTYSSIILSKGAKPVNVVDTQLCDSSVDLDLISKALTHNTKALIINTPNNPSGKVYSRVFLEELLRLARKFNFYIISDEVYERYVYEEAKHFSIGSIDEKLSNVITICSFSKTYSMTGWRVGYLVANSDLIEKILILSQISITNIASFNQLAACTAISDKEVEQSILLYVKEMSERFSIFSDIVNSMELQEFFKIPSAGFYCLMDISKFGSSIDASNYFLDKFHIALTPGIAFGDSMDSYLRFSIASQNKKSIIKALESVKIFIQN